MNVRKKKIERITITGKKDTDWEKAWEYIRKHDLRVKYSGPIFTEKYKADFSRFKIIAEREV